VIARFHDYFRACKDAIADALDTKPHSNRSSAQMTYVYQDFTTTTGELIDVGLNYSDDDLTLSPQVYRDAPYVWLTIEASDRPNSNAAIAVLQANPPEAGASTDRWWGRP